MVPATQCKTLFINTTCEISDIMFTQQIEVNFYMYVHPLEMFVLYIGKTHSHTYIMILCIRNIVVFII